MNLDEHWNRYVSRLSQEGGFKQRLVAMEAFYFGVMACLEIIAEIDPLNAGVVKVASELEAFLRRMNGGKKQVIDFINNYFILEAADGKSYWVPKSMLGDGEPNCETMEVDFAIGDFLPGADIVPREAVRWFSCEMEKKLLANDHKGKEGWLSRNCNYNTLKIKLEEEYLEVRKLLHLHYNKWESRNLIGECADIANIAMMIADRFRKRSQ